MYLKLECLAAKISAECGDSRNTDFDVSTVTDMIKKFPVNRDFFATLKFTTADNIEHTKSFVICASLSPPYENGYIDASAKWIKNIIKDHAQKFLENIEEGKIMIPSKNEYILNQLGKIVEQFQIQEALSDIDAARILVQLVDEKIKIACDTYESKPFRPYGLPFETR